MESTNIENGFSVDLFEIAEIPKEGILSKVLVKSDKYNFTVMSFAKSEELDTHTSTKNGGVYVLKGKGIFKLFDKEIEMKPGVFIFMPANAPHSLHAHDDLSILLLLTK